MDIDTILNRHESIKTPFYIYDITRIEHNIDRFQSIPYTHKSLHFASMANDNPALLSMLKKCNFNVFINSLKHLDLVLSCGFKPSDIIFASTGINKDTFQVIIEHGILVNLDSPSQVELYGQCNPGGKAGLRLNIDEKSKNNIFIGAESRIGVLESEFSNIFDIAARYNLKLIGTHVYLGTDVTSVDDILCGVEKTLALSDHFPDLEFIDLGGGFPIDRSRFDFDKYKNKVTELFEKYSEKRRRSIKLILEPGRSLFGDAASFYVTITDVKERPDRFLVCCDASASLIPRAMFYEDYNPVRVVNGSNTELFDKPVDIVGSTTYSRDFLAKQVKLSKVKIGDKLAFDYAGSYCYSMITRFLGQTIPPEYLITHNGDIEEIREREHLTDALKTDEVWTQEYIASGEKHCHRINKKLFAGKTEYQKVEIVETESYGLGLFLDGRIMHVEHDEYIYSESMVHPMTVILGNTCRHALVVGGGPGGIIRELLRYKNIESVTQVEIDQEIMNLCQEYFPHIHQNCFDDPRVQLVIADIQDFVLSPPRKYDIIFYDISEPFKSTPAANLFKKSMLIAIKDCLVPQGIFVTWAGSVAPRSAHRARNINLVMQDVFPYTFPYLCHTQSYGTSWLNIAGSQHQINPKSMTSEYIDGRIANYIQETLRLYDGESHFHMFHLPKDVRSFLDIPVETKELDSLEWKYSTPKSNNLHIQEATR